jgi:hypothetical protein
MKIHTIHVPLPARLDSVASTQQADFWPKWLNRFDRYRIASGLKDKPQQDQVSTMLYAMGDIADDILATLSINENTATYDEIKTVFNTYFNCRKNTIVARDKFNKRTQHQVESIDTFIQDLYKMDEDCNYANLKDELICDIIVVGVIDD